MKHLSNTLQPTFFFVFIVCFFGFSFSAKAQITGTTHVCILSVTALADTAGGGIWSSSNNAIAIVGSGSGIVTGVSVGIDTISYTVLGVPVSVSITVNPSPASIAGTAALCDSSTGALTDATPGGTWTSGSTAIASIGSASGIVTALAAGSATITYTLPTGCVSTRIVNVMPPAGHLIGCDNVGVGDTLTFNNYEPYPVELISSNSGVASVLFGQVVVGVSPGSATILAFGYTGCLAATRNITVTPTTLIHPITGSAAVCYAGTSIYSDPTPGGIWSTYDSAIASITFAGVLHGNNAGGTIISYTLSSGLANCTASIAVNALPDTPSGPGAVCVNDTILLASDSYFWYGDDLLLYGAYSSSNTSIATVVSEDLPSSGYIKGVSAGIAIITLTSPLTGCAITTTVTVNALPSPITGPEFFRCPGGGTTAYSDSLPGGTWTSSNPAIAAIGSTTGILTAGLFGFINITYTLASGCSTTKSATDILPTLAITGADPVCAGSTSVFSWFPGCTWSTGNPAIATIDSNTGLLTAIAPGTTTITPSLGPGCSVSEMLTVNPLPSAIAGPSGVCAGAAITLSDFGGGIWSSSNAGIATIGSSSGIATGIAAGTVAISYTIGTGCTTTKTVTVNAAPAAGTIVGPSSFCPLATITLTDSIPGGIWSSSTPAIATVSSTGAVTGILAGTDTIGYTLAGACGTTVAFKIITVTPLPDAGLISGAADVCVAVAIALSDSVTGGTWSAANGNATVAGGSVTGIVAGTDTIRYSATNACGTATATKTITVNPLPDPGIIAGASAVCVIASATVGDLIPGGSWSVSNGSATIISGLVTGVSAGADTINYSVTNTCGTAIATKIITVNPIPSAGTITGDSIVCAAAAITLTDSFPGGTWSATTSNATVTGGLVTGIATGTDIIHYSVTNSCGTAIATKTITVNPLPDPGIITGAPYVCLGAATTLTDLVPGGTWSATNGNASVTSGMVTGVSIGTDTIIYSTTNSCGTTMVNKIITVAPLPSAGTITGDSMVCVAAAITLTDSTSGGVWSSINGNATVSGGLTTGVATGPDTIKYSVTTSCGTAIATKTIMINPLPFAGYITGTAHVCVGSAIMLADTIAGGTWGSSNGNAFISGGSVTGVTAGMDTINYSISNICGTTVAAKTIIINALPAIYSITGGGGYCAGGSGVLIGLSGSDTGVGYVLYKDTSITGVALAGTGSALNFGMFTDTGIYSVKAIHIFTGCEKAMPDTDTVTITPTVTPVVSIMAHPGTHIGVGVYDTLTANATGGGTSPEYQWYLNGYLIAGATDSSYVSNAFFDGDSVSCIVTSSETCGISSADDAIITISSSGIQQIEETGDCTIFPNPNNGTFNFEFKTSNNEPVQIVVTNMFGEKIKEIKTTTNKQTHIELNVAAGIYFISANTTHGSYTGKITIE